MVLIDFHCFPTFCRLRKKLFEVVSCSEVAASARPAATSDAAGAGGRDTATAAVATPQSEIERLLMSVLGVYLHV